ncbi:hypothetical protein KUTeg_008365 [Tegillarca granosa]|uniref:Protein tyrosine phosphatase n=1 Tax=Tegillarca granosa TaxID=220873 RepID=A0ABQ9F8X3_TEGGR|nr:hypothetical protein KUTeg_008365 [Tegillarca granosa]
MTTLKICLLQMLTLRWSFHDDHSRVILSNTNNVSSSDYINASSITDHDPRNPAYIATQGPLPHTIADFWQVNLVVFDNLQVNLVFDYLQVNLMFNYFPVNLMFDYLQNSYRKVNKSYRGRSCPIVVHCSDGCGRTGTYALIDMVLNRMAKGAKEIDIAATLEHIRDQRMNMVKTKEQFQFALAAVAEEVHAILKALPHSRIETYYFKRYYARNLVISLIYQEHEH